MDENEQFPDAERRRRTMDLVMAAGQTLLENGAEVFRVEQTMMIMARSFHLREFHPYVLTNGIFAGAGTAELCEVRNVPSYVVHLGRIDAVNTLSRQVAAGGVTLDEAEYRLAQARAIPEPGVKIQLLGGLAGAFCFALLFGGTWQAGLAAAAAGLIVSAYQLWCERRGVAGGFRRLTASMLIALVCAVLCPLLHASISQAVIGALMLLTPGISFTMSIRDFVHGDYLSGMIRMIDALLVAASIAIGAGLVLRGYTLITGVTAL